jgi:hypothetical protein
VEVTVPAEERDIKESCRVLRKLGDERGDASDGLERTRLDELDGERAMTGGAEWGRRCDVGEPCAVGLDDEAGGKREGFGMTMGGRARSSLRPDGTSGRAEEGAGLGDGRVRRESREGRRAGRERGAKRCHDGTSWFLVVKLGLKHYNTLTTYGGPVGETAASSGDQSLLEFKLLSAARSRERNERSSVDASESGELAANGLVNWGEERRRLSEGEVAYISDEGLESVLVGRDDLRNL